MAEICRAAWRQENGALFSGQGLVLRVRLCTSFLCSERPSSACLSDFALCTNWTCLLSSREKTRWQTCSPRWCLTQDCGAFDTDVCALGPRWVFLYRARRSGCSRPSKSSTRFDTLQIQSNLCSTWFGATCASLKILEPGRSLPSRAFAFVLCHAASMTAR